MPAELTTKQRDIYDYIRSRIERDGFPPTFREIGSHFNIKSCNGVNCHIHALKRKGWIENDFSHARAFRLVEGARPRGMPIVGADQLHMIREVLAEFYQ